MAGVPNASSLIIHFLVRRRVGRRLTAFLARPAALLDFLRAPRRPLRRLGFGAFSASSSPETSITKILIFLFPAASGNDSSCFCMSAAEVGAGLLGVSLRMDLGRRSPYQKTPYTPNP